MEWCLGGVIRVECLMMMMMLLLLLMRIGKKNATQRKDMADLYTGALEDTSQLLPVDQPGVSLGWTRVCRAKITPRSYGGRRRHDPLSSKGVKGEQIGANQTPERKL